MIHTNNQSLESSSNKINVNNIIYLVNENQKTCRIIRNDSASYEIFIPNSINFKEDEFVVMSIFSGAFKYSLKLKSISFEDDSKLQTIEKYAFFNSAIESVKITSQLTKICESSFSFCENLKNIEIPSNTKLQTIEDKAFFNSSIEQISIPSSLIELNEGWCNSTAKLNKIKVSWNNPLYSSYDDKYIIGKSSIKKEFFDILVFSVRDIKIAQIPSFIETIGPYSFNKCLLYDFFVSTDSKLKTIGNDAFSHSSIRKISLPFHITKICERSFYSCKQIHCVEIPINSELKIIEKEAFSFSTIESVFIPFNVQFIDNTAFSFCEKLSIIEIDENLTPQIITQNMFEGCNNLIIMIPIINKK